MALGSMEILTIVILPIHEHGILLHLFVFSPISFTIVLQLSVYRSYTPLVKFIPKYSIVFNAIINEIVFFISFSDNSLLVYKNTTDFCMLILYPALLLKLLIRSNSFLVSL